MPTARTTCARPTISRPTRTARSPRPTRPQTRPCSGWAHRRPTRGASSAPGPTRRDSRAPACRPRRLAGGRHPGFRAARPVARRPSTPSAAARRGWTAGRSPQALAATVAHRATRPAATTRLVRSRATRATRSTAAGAHATTTNSSSSSSSIRTGLTRTRHPTSAPHSTRSSSSSRAEATRLGSAAARRRSRRGSARSPSATAAQPSPWWRLSSAAVSFCCRRPAHALRPAPYAAATRAPPFL